MRFLKKYEHGGVHLDLPEEELTSFDLPEEELTSFDLPEEELTRRELRRQLREDRKTMIPARFRSRGQEGLDDYRAMMRRRRNRPTPLKNILESLASIFQQKRGSTQKPGETAGMKCTKYGCSAYN